MARVLAVSIALFLALVLAAPPLALFWRGMPGVALACSLAAAGTVGLVLWARRTRLPLELTALLLLPPATAWGLGEGVGLFASVALWDTVAHLVAGFALGALGTPFARAHLRPGTRFPRALALLGGLGLAALAGALWEIGEWTSDTLLGSRTLGSAGDTVGDLAADLGGALVGGLLALRASSTLPQAHRERLARPFRALAGRA